MNSESSFNPDSCGPYNKSSMPEQVRPADSRPRTDKIPAPVPPRTLPVLSVWLRDLIISLAISAFIIIFLYQPVKVEGTSMMPSLDDQERIFVNKYVYRLEPIQRGDIVVFRYPRDTSKSFIKRVIGLAGDRIRIESGEVFVNGEALEEDYVPAAYADQRSYSRDRGASQQLLRAGRPSHHVERQPRLWPGQQQLYLRQGRVWILADG